MKAMELQGERLELFNEIINLDTESIEKVKKYIKRIAKNRYKITSKFQEQNEDWVDIMRPLTEEEKTSRLIAAEADTEYYTQEEMRKMVASWRTED